jgi:hypothetical protein
MSLEVDDYEQAVLNAVRRIGGVYGREWFRADLPEYAEAFDRLVARKILLPSTEYVLAPDVEEGFRDNADT